MAVSAKRCPTCSKFSPMDAEVCRNCSHKFQTHFDVSEPAPGFDRTQAFDAVLLPRSPAPAPPARRQHPISLLWFSLIALVSILAWAAWMITENAAVNTPAVFSQANATEAVSAKDLYDHINISMPLYELDKAADGMTPAARLITPPHLFLIYAFGAQSVRIMLYQRDPQSEDYHIVATSLWQGKTIVERKASDEAY